MAEAARSWGRGGEWERECAGGEGKPATTPTENSTSQGVSESSFRNLLDHAGFLLINTTVTLGALANVFSPTFLTISGYGTSV